LIRLKKGYQITEADWRLFTTLVRFDAVYYNHFKTNKKRLMDYPNLLAYTRELYQVPGIVSNGLDGLEINFLEPYERENFSYKNVIQL